MGRLIDHCIGAATEPNGAPSSARVYAGILLVTIPGIQTMVVLAIMTRLLTLSPTATNAPALTSAYLGFLRTFLLWTLLFDASTALSLYGINVWKYLVALRTGVPPVEGVASPEDVEPTTNSSSSIQPPKDVPVPTTNSSSSVPPTEDVVPPDADRT